MTIKWKTKCFKTLSVVEMYNILELRSAVFVVEQNCVYQDIDGKDNKALHLMGEFEDKIVAYARLFKAGDYFKQASIGRVVVDAQYRDRKWGHDLMEQAIKEITTQFGATKITISAQLYLQKFYESHGFVQTSEMYLEDNIPHLKMERG